MSANQPERPNFFEGQYLGAQDLDSLVDFVRDRHARHALGAHTWGIAMGLELTEEEAPGGDIEVYIQPGYAWDGYGRPIVVLAQYRLPKALFASCNDGDIEVWLRYDESQTKGVRPGFEVCDATDEYRRVQETFKPEIGAKTALEARQGGLSIAGMEMDDAREAFRTFVDDAPLVCDGSVPHQAFPAEQENSRWLVPLGVVKWKAGSPGHFEASEEQEHKRTRILRRYIGLVAEGIQAADDVIRLRSRTSKTVEGSSNDDVCKADRLTENDLTYDEEDIKVSVEDLVWVEGNLRVEGHTRLFGTRLELRNIQGGEENVPLFLQRGEKANQEGGQDLQVVLGDAAKSKGTNRLAIGTVCVSTDADGKTVYGLISEKVVIKDDGKVGIGTTNPENYLGSANDLVIASDGSTGMTIATGTGDTGGLVFADGDSGADRERGFLRFDHSEDLLSLGTNGGAWLNIDSVGRVGVGTDEPATSLHIGSGNDVTLADRSGYLLIGNTDDLNIVMDDNEIQARVSGLTSPLHLQAEGGDLVVHKHQDLAARFVVKADGKVGIGTSAPSEALHIKGDDPDLVLDINSGSSKNLAELQFRKDGEVKSRIYWSKTDNKTYLQNAGIDSITLDGEKIGMGTINPTEKLDVRGNVKLGFNSELFALGALQNLRVIVGRVNSNGTRNTGEGFKVARNGEGLYTITFTDSFPSQPIVLVTASDPSSPEDNIANPYQVESGRFKVSIWDAGVTPNTPEDSEFYFIALGPR